MMPTMRESVNEKSSRIKGFGRSGPGAGKQMNWNPDRNFPSFPAEIPLTCPVLYRIILTVKRRCVQAQVRAVGIGDNGEVAEWLKATAC